MQTVRETQEHGTVTLLLTDVEGSTRLWEKDSTSMHQSLGRLDSLIDDIVATHNGQVIKARGEGDSVVTVFARASDSVGAALALGTAIETEPWPGQIPLRVRIALHSGEVNVREKDLYGPTINRAARLRDVAHGGQVILSQATTELVREGLPSEATLVDLGLHRLRDLARPERVHQLTHPSLRSEFPRLRSLGLQNNNLPVQLTSFVGREDLIAFLRKHLEAARLVTLTGPGGSGKTRLAIQVAAEVVDDYPDGVWFVELAPISDAALISQAVASALGVSEQPGRNLLESLRDYIQPRLPKRLLLVLDNCEHLISEVALFAETLLRASAELKILVTSHEPLSIPGEVHQRVPPLAVPDPADPQTIDAIRNYEAVRLFGDRAFASNPEFAITPDNAGAVAEIAHRLDGLPLAIELAAAKTKILTVEQINERLKDRFRLLTGGSRTAPPRHQTLRSLIDWSHELLEEPERTLFRRVAVFQGGFTLEAAEGICSGSGLDESQLLELVSQLTSKSLVVPDEGSAGARYQMLDTVREYALEKLVQAKEANAFRDRHMIWFLHFAEKADSETQGPDQAQWLQSLEEDFENFRAALDWGLCEGKKEELVRLASSLSRLWHVRGHWSEGQRWLETAMRVPGDCAPAYQAKGLSVLGLLLDNHGEYESARDSYEAALTIRRELGDKEGIAHTLHSLGRLAGQQSRYDEAKKYMEEALEMRRELGDLGSVATTLGNLGLVARMQGDLDGAVSLYQQALETARKVGNLQHAGVLLNNLGVIQQVRQDHAAARPFHEESLAIKRELGDKSGIASSLNNLGWLAKEDGNLSEARALFDESLQISRSLGNKKGAAESLGNLGVLAKEQGDYVVAKSQIKETLALLNEIGDLSGLTLTFEVLAALVGVQDQPAQAARLYGASAALRQSIGVPLTPHELADNEVEVEEVRKQIDASRFEAEFAEGGRMSVEEAVEFAAGL